MEQPKLRIVFYEDETGEKSYFHLEKSEAKRVIDILKILPELKDWTPLSQVASLINASLLPTLLTILKLSGAHKIDIFMNDGKKSLARKPVLLIKKESSRSHRQYRFLKPAIYIKKRHS
ncbi:MAG: hypothetical protein A4E71_00549 [Smithella sp. PtaU1.Bin162]|nr:MAG: hypothetical protein A4E71_00549 [Smithella sp. PtaU1.Bin162]